MTMVAQQRPLTEIQEFIDARYANQQRARTATPLPPFGYVPPPYPSSGDDR